MPLSYQKRQMPLTVKSQVLSFSLSNPSTLSCSAPFYQQQSRAEHNKNGKNGAGMLVIIGACKDLFFGGDKEGCYKVYGSDECILICEVINS